MAPRRSHQRGGSSSPNAVLVIFLVLFVLTTFGLGGWAFSMMGKVHTADENLRKAEDKKKSAAIVEDFGELSTLELRVMLGDDLGAETEKWQTLRAEVFEPGPDLRLKEGGKFKDESFAKGKVALKKALEKARDDLGWNAEKKNYNGDYHKAVKDLRKELRDLRVLYAEAEAKKKEAEQKLASLDAKYKGKYGELLQAIKDGNEETHKYVKGILPKNEEAFTKRAEAEGNLEKKTTELTTANQAIDRLKAKVKELETAGPAGDKGMPEKDAMPDKGDKGDKGPKATPVSNVEPHALALDISKGKPLWDAPRGKIVRIDEKDRKVYIDKGSDDGVRPQLTFNVFAAGWNGKAEGPFKGTVEVIRVERKTAVARITSLYDSLGNEISLNDPNPGKILREGSNAWKEGDLLFNLTFGARVAIAGVLDWNGQGSESPSAQMEDLEEFKAILKSQGVAVDAWVDLRDGQLHGRLKPKTAYLIVGQRVHAGGKGEQKERAKAVNAAAAELRKEAVERGMFLISPDNFAAVAGYRRHRSKTDTELSAFRPGMPAGGVAFDGKVLGEGDKGVEGLADLAGRWSGKLAGGGQLIVNFRGEGLGWQMVVGMETLNGYSPVTRQRDGFSAQIQGRLVTLRPGTGTLQVSGQGMEATLTR